VYLVLVLFRHGWLWILDTGDPVKFPLRCSSVTRWAGPGRTADYGLYPPAAHAHLLKIPIPVISSAGAVCYGTPTYLPSTSPVRRTNEIKINVSWHTYIPPQRNKRKENKLHCTRRRGHGYGWSNWLGGLSACSRCEVGLGLEVGWRWR
jgi:hypothetical protein